MAAVNDFRFAGVIPASKSVLNRLLVIQSFASDLTIRGDSDCDDVMRMKSALPRIVEGKGAAADCGAAGTTFRFLVVRASRIPGKHLVTGTPRLLARPQAALLEILKQLGVEAQPSPSGFVIQSQGWKKPTGPIRVDRSQSSQFASAVLLSAWDLDFDLEIEFVGVEDGDAPSEGYFEITEQIVRDAGMRLERNSSRLFIPARSRVRAGEIEAESDLSSAFAVAALGAIGGEAVIRSYPEKTSQPDAVFPEILQAMGARITRRPGELQVNRAEKLKAVEWNLRDCPDLFPVLSVLCAFAEGRSRLFGAPHLVHKESSRIESSARIVEGLGCKVRILPDGMEIEGGARRLPSTDALRSGPAWEFDPLEDHRLAMAAAVARLAGAPVRILHPDVVNKSFPGFWAVFTGGGGRLL